MNPWLRMIDIAVSASLVGALVFCLLVLFGVLP